MALDLAGRVLRSRTVDVLTAPHGIDRYLKQVHPMWAAHEVRARIVEAHPETDEVTTLTLQPTSTWAGHRPGQHIRLGVEVDGTRRLTRVFTIASAAGHHGERFQITLRANPDAPAGRSVSRLLSGPGAVGRVVQLSQAEGDFVLPDHVPEHIVLISGGSGITPVMAMLRSLQRRTHRGRVTFLHWSHTPEQQIFADELDAAAHSGHGVEVHRLHPGQGDPYLSPALLDRLVPGWRDLPTWACGPAPLIEAVQAAYGGAPGLRVEYFKLVSTGSTDGVGSTNGGVGGEITFTRSGLTVPNTGASLLEQAEAAGLTPEYGCRMGICFSCTTRKDEGTTRNLLTGETASLPDDIRICVSAPDGDCSVEL